MTYMLDTNICSYILKERPAVVRDHFRLVPPESLVISTIVLAELNYWADVHPKGEMIRRQVNDLVSRLRVLSWDDGAARHYGTIRADLKVRKVTVGNMDMLIAAHARSVGATLVTNNMREFVHVPGLLLENWAQG